MVAYLKTAKDMCKGSCPTCDVKDERAQYGPTIVDWLSKEYWEERIADVLPSDVCPIGLPMGKRLEEYGLNNPSPYSGKIISCARSLQKNSVENVNPEKIQSNMSFLGAYINLSKEMLPPPAVVEFHEAPTTKESLEIKTAPISMPEVKTPISRISTSARRFLKDFRYSLLF